ncbi:DMT family transporter [Halomonas shantousis]
MPHADNARKADILLLLVTLLAALGWIFSKEALAGMPPLLFIGTRFLLAGLILGAFGWPGIRVLRRPDLLKATGVGLVFAAAMGFWSLGLFHTTHLGEGAFINSLGILLVPVMARLLFGDIPPRTTWTALPVAMTGFACLSLSHGFRVEPGQWLFLASAVTFAFLFNCNSRVVRSVPAVPLTAIQLVVVGIVTLLLSVFTEIWPSRASPAILGWLFASILLASTLRFFIQIYAQGLTTPSHAAVIMMLEAVWTALFAAYWFGETMNPLQLFGCALIFLALVVNRWTWIRRLILPARRY